MDKSMENRIRLPQQEKRLISIISWMFVLSLLVNLALCGVVVYIYNLKEKVPYLITYSKSEDILFEVHKISDALKSNAVFIEQQLESYVLKRETHNQMKEFLQNKYEYILSYSSQRVYSEYVRLYEDNKDVFNNSTFNRSIEILNTSLIGKSIAMIDFKVTDTINSNKSYKYFKATIEYAFYPQKVSYENAKINPVGLTVENYQISVSRLKVDDT